MRALLWWAAGFLLVAMALMGSMWLSMALLEAGQLPGTAAAEAREQMAQFNAMMGPDSPDYARDVAHYLGSYGAIAGMRLGAGALEPLTQVMLFLWESMALMLSLIHISMRGCSAAATMLRRAMTRRRSTIGRRVRRRGRPAGATPISSSSRAPRCAILPRRRR